MTDVPTLATALLANFVTVRFLPFQSPDGPLEGLAPTRTTERLATAFRADWLIIRCHRLRIRCELVEHGHSRFLDRIEADSNSSWRVHFFCLDEAAAKLIAKISGKSCCSGTPLRFNPTDFVLARLNTLQRWGKLEHRYPWWDTDVE